MNTLKQTVKFEEFSVETSIYNDFMNITPSDDLTIKEMYRCDGEDLTITSFDKNYIEDEYYNQNGEKINYTKMLMNKFKQDYDNISRISDNLTLITVITEIDGDTDTDVAALYNDESHLIIIEGGDVEFISETAKSIHIL